MGEVGKRSRSRREDEDDDRYYKRRQSLRESSGAGDLVVYRILCPARVIGIVIGKGGKVINAIRQETHAKIKVVDPFPGCNDRVLTIYCYVKNKDEKDVDEDDTRPICAAQDALFKVHAAIVNAVATADDYDKRRKEEEVRILVPSSQAANIIGKAGSTIKRLRIKTRTHIKVTPKDPKDPDHSCAMSFDNFVQISGDAGPVKKALYAVSAIMYRISPREDISLDTVVPELPPSIIIPSDVPMIPAAGFFSSADAIHPSRSIPPIIGMSSHVPDLQRYADAASTWPLYPSGLPVVPAYGGSLQSEELKVRVLCPSDKIGRVIGKGGASIKSVRQATGARIEVNDSKNDSDECIISVTSTESLDDMKSTSVEAVLLLQGKINGEDDDDGGRMRILVPSKVIGCLIGKSGAIINEIRKRTRADVRISKSDRPRCALDDEELVEISGEVACVRDALVQVVLRLRDDVLRDRDGNGRNAFPQPPVESSAYVSGIGASISSSLMPSVPRVGYDQRADHSAPGRGTLSSNNVYDYGSLSVGNGYRSYPSYSSETYEGLQSAISELRIPAHAVSKVMGKGGSNLTNIRKISGAIVDIVDSKSSRGDRIAQISGTSEQKRSAENLIQAFILAT